MEDQAVVDHGMNQILLTQVEQLVKGIEEVEVIDQVLEPLVVVVEQVPLVEMQEANIWVVMEVTGYNPR